MPEPIKYSDLVSATLINPCPASIWLLGGAAQCKKQRGHDGNHAVLIEWTTEGMPHD